MDWHPDSRARCNGDDIIGHRVFGEAGWRICDNCGHDELPTRPPPSTKE